MQTVQAWQPLATSFEPLLRIMSVHETFRLVEEDFRLNWKRLSKICSTIVGPSLLGGPRVQGEEAPPPGEVDPKHPVVPNALWAIVGRVKQRIVDGFTPEARSVFEREFRLFDGITAISGKIKPLPKEQRRAAIKP